MLTNLFTQYLPNLPLLQEVSEEHFSHVEKFNFTGHRTPEAFFMLNILDSVLPVVQGLMHIQEGVRVADLGTGGGFPGVPLATMFPEASFTLFDSVGKKLQLIQDISKTCTLPNIQTVHTRLEGAGQHARYRGQFDVVVTKALAKWTTLLEYALPFLAVGGTFYAYQGEEVLEQIDAHAGVLTLLGGELLDVKSYELPMDYGTRYIVAIQKNKPTPALYPRKVGIPKDLPLS